MSILLEAGKAQRKTLGKGKGGRVLAVHVDVGVKRMTGIAHGSNRLAGLDPRPYMGRDRPALEMCHENKFALPDLQGE